MSFDEVVIDIDNVRKVFDSSTDPGASGSGMPLIGRLGKSKAKREPHEVLKGISLQVRRGESVGIIGRNGAGKSTLLRIVSGLMQPDQGSVTLSETPYSVMGLGVGFKDNLTGRENIFIKTAIMGISREEVEKQYESIVAFAEIGDFINRPLRIYSKGMRSRLAFAITFAFEPRLLIIDEALSGGDAAFKRRAEARLNEISESGATILLVSHGGAHHKRLCNRSVLLEDGAILNEGTPRQIFPLYRKLVATPLSERPDVIAAIRDTVLADTDQQTPIDTSVTSEPQVSAPVRMGARHDDTLIADSAVASTPNGAVLEHASIQNKGGRGLNVLPTGKRFRVVLSALSQRPLEGVWAEISFKADDGTELGGMRSHMAGEGIDVAGENQRFELTFSFENVLLDGDYFIDCVLYASGPGGARLRLHRVTDMIVFRSLGRDDDAVFGMIDFS